MDKVKILLVDDQEIVREGLKAILASDSRLEIVGEAGDGAQAAQFCQNNTVDVALMDIRMPGVDGVEGTRLIDEQASGTRVLILTTFEEDRYIADALKWGASGYLLKDAGARDIISAIHAVHSGSVLMHPRVAHRVMSWGDSSPPRELTGRELDIIALVGQGSSNQEIAQQLHISQGTVKNHLTTVYEKLSLRDRTALAIWAREHNLGKRS